MHKRPLSSAVSCSPTSQVWVCARRIQGGHGCGRTASTTVRRQETRGWVQT
ncbi:hypothetical protein I79_025855 [Cricetulus griseus]|uniref:Uncharacterized protein n=1 Tax=Cricetulus griseus TaxID=10029 RepID=G3IPE8_CRIGR|nr:hypothetical protein I79_025855 [Cricetulus griseus]